jgi:ATP-dependent DNA helicase RecG
MTSENLPGPGFDYLHLSPGFFFDKGLSMNQAEQELLQKLQRAGFSDPIQMLCFAPTAAYDLRRLLTDKNAMNLDKPSLYEVSVQSDLHRLSVPDPSYYGYTHLMEVSFGKHKLQLTFPPRAGKQKFTDVRIGQKIYFYGTITKHPRSTLNNRILICHNPLWVDSEWVGRIMPVYPHLKDKENSKRVLLRSEEVRYFLSIFSNHRETLEIIADKITGQLGQLTPPKAHIQNTFKALHRPVTLKQWHEALLCADDLSIRYLQASEEDPVPAPASALPITDDMVQSTLARSPFPLSPSQREAIYDIVEDLRSDFPMNRLVSGDVGSGKTIVQFMAVALGHQCHVPAGIVAPNTLLATQLYDQFRATFPDIPCAYVASGTSRKGIDLSQNPVLIGTTAILSFMTKHKLTFGVIAIDEEQKMGANQKRILSQGESVNEVTNTMQSTATAIPKSLGSVLISRMKVSRIMPFTEKQIASYIVGVEGRKWLMERVQEAMAAGSKVAVVFPRVQGDDEDQATAGASERASLMKAIEKWEKAFPGRYAILHGGMSEDEKKSQLGLLKDPNGQVSILLCSTVFEIGLTVEELRLLIVHSPEFLGASQLHQLRGRLSRHGGTGMFVMYCPNPISEKTLERLKVVASTNDGFYIAEKDMNMRGLGDILGNGTRQHGKTPGLFLNRTISDGAIKPYMDAIRDAGSLAKALESHIPELSI